MEGLWGATVNLQGVARLLPSYSLTIDSSLTAVRANLGVLWRTDEVPKRSDLYTRRTTANDRDRAVIELKNR